jgi:hypothetical protein
MMKRVWWLRGLKLAAFGAVAVLAFGLLTMMLWNWLLPGLFGLPAIGFWQALGLLVLARVLVGGRGGRQLYWRARMQERWERMSDEERARFRAGLHRHCGGDRPPANASPGAAP